MMLSNPGKMDMSDIDRHAHWENVYQTKGEREVSWFQESPKISLILLRATGVSVDALIVDIGGGASRLVDALLDAGFEDITVLDLSAKALATSRQRWAREAQRLSGLPPTYRVGTIPVYDVWHNRAAFHFLTEPKRTAPPMPSGSGEQCAGGHVIIGTFALRRYRRCSGLPVVRYDTGSLGIMLGPSFKLIEARNHVHQTPMGTVQRFQFSRFRRLN